MRDGKVQVGFIGVGNFIAGHHLLNVHENPAMRVRALCDVNEPLLGERAARFPCDYTTTDYRRLLNDPEIDMVVIGTRHDMHAPLSIQAMRAGKDVLCEKPMSDHPEDMAEIVRVQNETGRRYVVGHNRRFAPAMIEAKRILASRPRPFMALYRIVDNAKLWPAWPMDPAHGGKILSECCHIFDALAWLFDAEPTRVFAVGGLDDNNIVTLTFDDGTHATVVSGGLGSELYPKELLEVFCGGATVAVDMFLQLKVSGIEGESDRFYPLLRDPWSHLNAPPTSEGFRKRAEEWKSHILPEDFERKSYSNFPQVDKGHYNETALLAEAIRANGPSPANAIDAARATICCFKAIESLKTGLPVPICKADYFAT